ncbi:MAG TPA: DMT family transporter, partial [Actinomycetota bacterium]|nr:DMT family transporter [Actinomycetota bacterium]
MVGAGLATVLGNTQVVFVAIAAWMFFGERLTARLIVALVVALGGVVLISGVLGGEAYGENPIGGVLLGLFTGAAYAGFLLVQRLGNRDTRRPAGPLMDATASAAVASALAGLVLGQITFLPSWPAHGWLLILALSAQVVGYLLISVALPRLPSALTSIVLLIQPVAAVGLAMLILGESPSATQLMGVGLVVGGVLLATARAPRGRQAAVAEATEGP